MLSLLFRGVRTVPSLYNSVFTVNKRSIMSFVDPRMDAGFKTLFSSPITVKSFLNALLHKETDSDPIDVVHIDPCEQTGDYGGKRTFIDVHCTTSKGEKYIVEMQRYNTSTPKNKEFLPRVQFYYCKDVINQYKIKFAEWKTQSPRKAFLYSDLKKVHVVAILAPSGAGDRYSEKYFFNDKKIIKQFRLCNVELLNDDSSKGEKICKEFPSGLVEYTFVELAKMKYETVKNDKLKDWLELLSAAHTKTEIPPGTSGEIRLGYDLLDFDKLPPEQQVRVTAEQDGIREYELQEEAKLAVVASESRMKGRSEGRKEAEQEKKELIKSMVKQGIDLSVIASITKMGEEEVKAVLESGESDSAETPFINGSDSLGDSGENSADDLT